MPKGIPKNDSEKRKILHRLKIARGHLDKVIQMTESDAYCIDVVHQSLAVQSALKKVNEILLEHHINHCVASSLKEGTDTTILKEVMSVIHKT